jgi:hypothetical protein
LIADFECLDIPPALFKFRPMNRDHPLTVEPFHFSSRQGGVAYQGSYDAFFATALGENGQTQSKTV